MRKRNYGIDLLRIISMIMITSYHIIIPGIGQNAFYNGPLSTKILYAICSCGVNCFILISGYVNLTSDYKISRLINILFEALFYNLFLTILISTINNTLSFSRIIESFNLLGNEGWWFIKAYTILFVFIPLLNSAIQNLNKKRLNLLILLLAFFASIYTTFMGDVFYIGEGFSALWFIILYIFGAYIKKYEDSFKINKVIILILFILCIILTVSSFYIIYKYNGIHLDTYIEEDILFKYTSPTIVISSLILLLFFKDIKLNGWIQKIVIFVTPSIFSVYLIQCQHYIYSFYFPDYFDFLNAYNYRLLIYIPLLAITIVTAFLLLDQIRVFLFKICRLNDLYSFIDSKFNNIK